MKEEDARTPEQRFYHFVIATKHKAPWAPAVANAAAVLGAAALSANVGDPPDVNVPVLLGAIACTAVSLGLTFLTDAWRRQASRAERSEAALLRLTLTDAVQPMVRNLARMPSKPSRVRATALEIVIGNAAAALQLMLPRANRLRIVVYRLEVKPDGKRQLIPSAVGRNDNARRHVENDGGKGQRMFEFMARNEAMFVGDTHTTGGPTDRSYRTFISTPIVAEDDAFGILCVDSPTPGSLDQADMPMVDVVAEILAIAFAEANRP